jgi:hypothetical protein
MIFYFVKFVAETLIAVDLSDIPLMLELETLLKPLPVFFFVDLLSVISWHSTWASYKPPHSARRAVIQTNINHHGGY